MRKFSSEKNWTNKERVSFSLWAKGKIWIYPYLNTNRWLVFWLKYTVLSSRKMMKRLTRRHWWRNTSWTNRTTILFWMNGVVSPKTQDWNMSLSDGRAVTLLANTHQNLGGRERCCLQRWEIWSGSDIFGSGWSWMHRSCDFINYFLPR